MWPFAKKQLAAETTERTSAQRRIMEMIGSIAQWRAIGEEFEYLGRRMVVTGYCRMTSMFTVEPNLRANYVDDSGVIHHIEFNAAEVSALMLAQPKHGVK